MTTQATGAGPRAVPEGLGPQELTSEDRKYDGSRYREVRDALFENPYYDTWEGPGSVRWPDYRVTLGSVVTGLLPFGKPFRFLQAARRTVASGADLRWGPDGRGFRRLLHPNGICLLGRWEITEPTQYSGHFRQGSEALLVARYSTCCTETRRGHTRSLSLVGKLWPTTDPEHPRPLRTANFFTQEDFGGERTDFVNDAVTRNAPNTTAWRRGAGIPVFLLTGLAFMKTDRQPTQRQLFEIAELGKGDGEPTRTPEFMRLRMAEGQPRIDGDGLDFRDEILAQIYDPGDPEPRRDLVFDIEVTDRGTSRGPAVFQRRTNEGWRRIGRLVFHEAVASYNGDFVLHFHHPPWREDRNDPST